MHLISDINAFLSLTMNDTADLGERFNAVQGWGSPSVLLCHMNCIMISWALRILCGYCRCSKEAR